MNIFHWLGAGGGAVAITALVLLWPNLRKLRAEYGKTRTDAAIAVDAADDAHWRAIVTAQTEALIQPLREEVERQGREISHLREDLAQVTHKHRSAITYIRALLAAWRRQVPDVEPPVPPAELAADI